MSGLKRGIKEIVSASLPNTYENLKYLYQKHLKPKQYPNELARWFRKVTGGELVLEQPTSFNQKIQWLKLYDSTPEKGRLADKYLVREYVSKRIGGQYLVPLLGVWDDPDDINFDILPNRFVLKATHGCGWNVIVQDKSRLDIKATRKQLRKWLRTDWAWTGGLELHYQYCLPRIVAERYLEDASGDLCDYKVHVFNAGEPIILVCKDRNKGDLPKKAYYDASWNPIDLHEGECEAFVCPCPEHLEEMLENSYELACGFKFVRVDWYEADGKLWFGEMTFTPSSGVKHFVPSWWNFEFGRRIDLKGKPIGWSRAHRLSGVCRSGATRFLAR